MTLWLVFFVLQTADSEVKHSHWCNKCKQDGSTTISTIVPLQSATFENGKNVAAYLAFKWVIISIILII